MKILKYYSAITFLVLSLSGCESFLDIKSESKFDSTSVFNNINSAEMATMACYESAYNEEMWYQFGAGNDEIFSTEGETNSKNVVGNFVLSPTTTLASSYTSSYKGIERCNACIQGLEGMALAGSDANRRDAYVGELLALRAHYYWQLIRLYGDVPFTVTPVAQLSEFTSSRTNRDVIYDHIIADLQRATKLLPWYSESGYMSPERISKNAAYGLLSRIAIYAASYSLRWDLNTFAPGSLQMARREDATRVRELYTIARDAANEVMLKGENDLVGYEEFFRGLNEKSYKSKESLFEFAQYGSTTNGRLGYTNGMFILDKTQPYLKTQPAQYILPTFYLSFAEGDLRRDVAVANYVISKTDGSCTAATFASMANGKYRATWKKEPSYAMGSKTNVNFPILRYSDVLLMFAEAENELNNGPTPAARVAFEKVRTRAFGGDASKIGTTPSGYTEFLDAIIQERSWEFSGEGLRRSDLTRFNRLGVVVEVKEKMLKLSKREGQFASVKSWRAYQERKATTWKDPLVALVYEDFDHEPTADELAALAAAKGGTWKAINLFDKMPVGGYSGITGYIENQNVIPAWIGANSASGLFRGYKANQVELLPLHQINIIDVNTGLRGQQHPGY